MIKNFEDFLVAAEANIPLGGFILNLILSAVLAFILSKVYTRFGNSLSNRSQSAKNFVLLTLTTMLVISIVKSSLALSLGLVGALSIIRFRAAIKEPEELAYLFLAIALGLGFGANQTVITIVAFGIIVGIIVLSKRFSKRFGPEQNLQLILQSKDPKKSNPENIIGVLKGFCTAVDLRRLDESADFLEMSLVIETDSFEKLNEAKVSLQNIDNQLKFTILDNKGLL